jgi:hypothetical protein
VLGDFGEPFGAAAFYLGEFQSAGDAAGDDAIGGIGEPFGELGVGGAVDLVFRPFADGRLVPRVITGRRRGRLRRVPCRPRGCLAGGRLWFWAGASAFTGAAGGCFGSALAGGPLVVMRAVVVTASGAVPHRRDSVWLVEWCRCGGATVGASAEAVCVLPTPCWFMGVIFEGAAGGKQGHFAPEPVSTSLMS